MTQEERANLIIRDLIAIPKDLWERSEHGGQGIFTVDGLSGHALYFSEDLLNADSDHPWSRDAQEMCRIRLGSKRYAVEIWQEGDCVCLLRWNVVDEIEVAEYTHGPWEMISFGLPPVDANHAATIH